MKSVSFLRWWQMDMTIKEKKKEETKKYNKNTIKIDR